MQRKRLPSKLKNKLKLRLNARPKSSVKLKLKPSVKLKNKAKRPKPSKSASWWMLLGQASPARTLPRRLLPKSRSALLWTLLGRINLVSGRLKKRLLVISQSLYLNLVINELQ